MSCNNLAMPGMNTSPSVGPAGFDNNSPVVLASNSSGLSQEIQENLSGMLNQNPLFRTLLTICDVNPAISADNLSPPPAGQRPSINPPPIHFTPSPQPSSDSSSESSESEMDVDVEVPQTKKGKQRENILETAAAQLKCRGDVLGQFKYVKMMNKLALRQQENDDQEGPEDTDDEQEKPEDSDDEQEDNRHQEMTKNEEEGADNTQDGTNKARTRVRVNRRRMMESRPSTSRRVIESRSRPPTSRRVMENRSRLQTIRRVMESRSRPTTIRKKK